MDETTTPAGTPPAFREALRFWLKLGFISFGGPTGQIAIMHEEVVERRKWIGESHFLHALNYCMLLPGPEAQQLAIYIGWLLHGTLGGIAAGALFVLPSVFILWTLSYVYVAYGSVGWVASIFYGLKPAVIAIVAHAVWRIGRRTLKTPLMWCISAASFVAIFFLQAPFPLIIVSAGIFGLVLQGTRWKRAVLSAGSGHSARASRAPQDDEPILPPRPRPTPLRAFKVLAVCLLLWGTPILAAGITLGWHHSVTTEGVFFSKAAMVTFGGAYAVLPYVAQQTVERYEWLSTPQMLDGLGLAETTPGPLIMVVQFVGFLGGWNQPGSLPPLYAATLGALLTTWVTFVPCFLWIFLGAPYVETMRKSERLTAALNAISAAVVGVVLNLAVWFAGSVLAPAPGQVDVFAALVSIASFAVLTLTRFGVVTVIACAGLAGLGWRFIG